MYNLEEDVKLRRKTWIKIANIPTARVGWTLEDCTDISDDDMELVNNWLKLFKRGEVIRATNSKFCGKGLMLWGKPGQGKTTLALSLMQDVLRTFSLEEFDVKEGGALIRPAYFTTYNDLLSLYGRVIHDEGSDDDVVIYQGLLGECPNDAYNIRLLIIDDIGKEHTTQTGWQKNVLHQVLRTRFNNGLPTIVTTNIEKKNWAGLYGDATESFANEAFGYLPINSLKGDLRK